MLCLFAVFASSILVVFLGNSGEKKLSKLATPDVWKEGSKNSTTKGEGQRAVGTNKLLAAKKKYVHTSYDVVLLLREI
jgi:hypothetical protein